MYVSYTSARSTSDCDMCELISFGSVYNFCFTVIFFPTGPLMHRVHMQKKIRYVIFFNCSSIFSGSSRESVSKRERSFTAGKRYTTIHTLTENISTAWRQCRTHSMWRQCPYPFHVTSVPVPIPCDASAVPIPRDVIARPRVRYPFRVTLVQPTNSLSLLCKILLLRHVWVSNTLHWDTHSTWHRWPHSTSGQCQSCKMGRLYSQSARM